jgi:hypothetical protein
MTDSLFEALMELYKKSTPEQGQHDLARCRFCGQEQNWDGNGRGWDLIHKPNCPVEKVRQILAQE